MEEECKDCDGTRRIKEQGGTIHPCYKCLAEGKMDQHATNIKDASDFGIKL